MSRLPVSLYVHFPWCIRKCPYCDFNSHEVRGDLGAKRYLDALSADFDLEVDKLRDREINSIFLGGGTPSLFSGAEIAEMLKKISDGAQLADDVEITMEANPGTLESDTFDTYLEAGVNRLSIGIQSFNDAHLKTLGRIHNSISAQTAIRNAADAGFTNINLDVMFALPDQDLDQALEDCARAVAFGTTHLSFYQLTIEPNTLFHRYPPNCPDSDMQHEMQESIAGMLEVAGYHRYEVSAYSVPGRECRHNLNYWKFGDYLGIGAGAHSKWTTADAVERCWKEKRPETFMQKIEAGIDVRNTSVIPGNDLLFEYMLNALRLKDGFSLRHFERLTGLDKTTARTALEPFADRGWIMLDDTSVRCSDTGYLFIDEILQSLLPDPATNGHDNQSRSA